MSLFSVSLLEGDLADVEAMRDVKVELIAKKEVTITLMYFFIIPPHTYFEDT